MNAVLKHKPKQLRINTSCELIVDLFAGGGGASLGIEMATGRMMVARHVTARS